MALFNNLLTLLGISSIRTTAYHTLDSGLDERFHRSIKTSPRAQPDAIHWSTSLLPVMLNLHATLKENQRCTSTETVLEHLYAFQGNSYTPAFHRRVLTASTTSTGCEHHSEHFVLLSHASSTVRHRILPPQSWPRPLMFLSAVTQYGSPCSSSTTVHATSSIVPIHISPWT